MILTRFFLYAIGCFFLTQWLTQSLYHSSELYALATLPGTVTHELAHYLMALALDGHPFNFSIWPTWSNGQMDSMGHIQFYPNWYNNAAVGTAPLLLMPATAFLTAMAARSRNPLSVLLWLWTAASSWLSSTPSSADLSISYPQSWVVAIPVLLFSIWATYKVTRYTLKI